MQTIVIANQKGGVGKTTTAVTLGVCFAHAGAATLLLDLDPQANASSALLGGPGAVAEAVAGHSGAHPFAPIRPTHVPGLSVIPASPGLREWDARDREDLFRSHLKRLQETSEAQARILLIDCSPSLGPLVRAALRGADLVVAPVQCEYFAMEGLSQLLRSLESIERPTAGTRPEVLLLLTMHDPELRLSAEVSEEVRRHFPDRTLRVYVPRDIQFSEASSHSRSLFEYDPTSVGTRSYIEVVREILYERVKGA
ncbi:MAG: ParA family protein [Planctomycetes bacterium]|nr:ParA family protein [Planctomycetota bacterium]